MKHAFALVVIAILGGTSLRGQSSSALFQQALAKERAEGKLVEAIQIYERILTDFPGDRPVAARALLQMGRCYERLGKREAQRVYDRLVRDYGDQRSAADEARSRLARLSRSTADAIFREAQAMERTEGRVKEAIFRYERVVAEFPSERVLLVEALHQLALAYEKLRDPRAGLMWSRLAAAAAPNPYAGEAKKRLEAVQSADSGPFTSRTVDVNAMLGSPDGRWLISQKEPGSGKVTLRDLSTDAERVLIDLAGSVGAYAWSPDSRELAFSYSNNPQGIRDIRIATVETGAIRSLGQRGYPLGWTKKNEIFAYRPNYAQSTFDLFLIPVRGGEPRLAFSDPTDTCGWAIVPDGDAVVTCRSKRLVLRNVASGLEQAVTAGSGEESGPIVSADGRLVAFSSNVDGHWAIYVAPLDRLPVRSPAKISIISDDSVPPRGGGMAPWWTQDGLLTLRVSHGEANVYRVDMNAATGRATDSPIRLTQDMPASLAPSTNPDATRIVYFYRKGTSGGIAVMKADGSSERPLIEQGGRLALFWRSSEEILFRNFGAPGASTSTIAALNVDTGALTDVVKVDGLYWSYLPARSEIVHLYPKGGGFARGAELKVYSLADGKDRVVATIDFLGPYLAVSPDGRHIAYFVAPTGAAADGCELALMNISGAREKVLVPFKKSECVGAASWSPDGRFLLLNAPAGPAVMEVDTLQSWPVHAEAAGSTWQAGDWAPTGAFVTLTRSAQRTERLAWERVTFDAVAKLLGR
jgi:Tol biopolymer transport system component